MSPNAAFITAGLTILALVLSIFGASWLNQRATEKLIEQMEKRFDAKFDAMNARFDSINHRFSAVEQRLDRIERQLEAVFKPVLPPRT
ncbi:MAG: hypothetical protein HY231_26535 [Acidobacteria bacterium]|nr:hypothetical protein [Acidobacteriota bacterium]